MFVHVKIFSFVLLLSSVCQAPAPCRKNSLQNSETNLEESGTWIVKVFKRMYRGAKEWAFGEDGFITNLVVKTGDRSDQFRQTGQCCCCCHKKSDSDQSTNLESDGSEIRCCSVEGAKECLSVAWHRKGDVCVDCAVCGYICCKYCVGKPCGCMCRGLEMVLCNDPMVNCYCGIKDAIKYPFTKIRQCLCKND